MKITVKSAQARAIELGAKAAGMTAEQFAGSLFINSVKKALEKSTPTKKEAV